MINGNDYFKICKMTVFNIMEVVIFYEETFDYPQILYV